MAYIYIVGYPKSGNTWLTRMMSRVTRLPVKSYGGSEIAADVNKEVENQAGIEDGWVCKLHEMPGEFQSRLADEARGHDVKIVYIRREIEDVFVSSFFYFKKSGVESFIELSGGHMKLLNPSWLARRIYWRMRLSRYLDFFLRQGYAKGVVTYTEHVTAWREYLRSCDGKISYAMVKYEDLVADPVSELGKACERIGYAQLDAHALEEAVKNESFATRKKNVETSESEALTFGKEFNQKFLRAGKAGENKRFLTTRQQLRLRAAAQGF